jgi:hypothetical protein
MSYAPKQGSDEARMVAWLKTQQRSKPAGAWSRNCVMARALGVEGNAVPSTLKAAVEAGWVERMRNSTGRIMWRMTPMDGAPVPPMPVFRLDWPPGFSSKFDSVVVPAWQPKARS